MRVNFLMCVHLLKH